MLSYRHIFHAGNHADIFKHMTLIMLLDHMNAKDKPYTVIDTHAGAGRYDLNDERALKTGESENGIKRLLADTSFSGFMQYTDFASSCLRKGFYPGSPEIERCFMRSSDVLILCELHNTEIDILRQNMNAGPADGADGCPRVQIHHRDGFEALKALTPPPIKRGLVLTDPSYEDADEYARAADAFSATHAKWPAAVLALWYPLLSHRRIECGAMRQKITAAVKGSAVPSSILDAQLLINKEDSHKETTLAENERHTADSDDANPPRLYGSGMFIVNFPWKLDDELKDILPYLSEKLGTDGSGSWSVTTD